MRGNRRAAVAAAVVTACFGPVTAFAGDHTVPGTAGAAGCVGQSQAFFAQLGKNLDGEVGNGIGGLGHSADVSPPDLHAAAVANCAVNP